MAASLQQRALVRKFIYTGLILALFTVSLLHRRFVVEPQANNLLLREVARGEVELTSSAVRLLLTGSRGLAVTFLWDAAIKKQEKHEWNELELLVRSITKLQPYFVTPWLFQSWNLAFNVSVECDRPRDKYYYVSRGLNLLAEGERRNHAASADADPKKPRFPGNPDMRHSMGFFYQLKIGTSDEKNVMRCLLEMSAIDPLERDPVRLWIATPRGRAVDKTRFFELCQRYPRLIKRIHDKFGNSPDKIVKFLEDNRDVPSRFDPPAGGLEITQSPLKKPSEQFPLLPPRIEESWPNPESPVLTNENLDVFLVSRTWYQYSQIPLPPPTRDLSTDPAVNSTKHRVPRYMSITIFRGYPARAQSYVAENLQLDGWFDDEGWVITDWFGTEDVRVGTEPKYHSGLAWERAYQQYMDYGRQNGLFYTRAERAEMEAKAKLVRDKYGAHVADRNQLSQADLQNDKMRESVHNHLMLYWSASYRNTTNYDGQMRTAEAERLPETVYARKLFFDAEYQRRFEDPERALSLYDEAWPIWIDVVLSNLEFGRISTVQEDVYELLLENLRLMQKQRTLTFKKLAMGMAQWGNWPYPPWEEVLDTGAKIKITPIRTYRGILDQIAYYNGPEADALKAFVLQWTQGAAGPIRMIYPGQLSRTLTTTVWRGTMLPPSWAPLADPMSIMSVRERLGLMRGMPPPGAMPGMPPSAMPIPPLPKN
ncbi:MAG: hypothetical protein L0Y70_08890 [Gemmataceae bacterium]|nr:hypothetical protein [Gemmataceae bacterium]